MVQKFARGNFLRLSNKMKQCIIDGEVIPACDVGKCLGY